jgi:hypothetical protein
MSDDYRPQRRPDIETHLLPDSTCLLFDPRTEDGHVLNVAGALIWDYCDGILTSEEIATEVAALVPNIDSMRSEALQLIDQFAEMNLFDQKAVSANS